MSKVRSMLSMLLALVAASSAEAQSINIDFHNASGTPSSGYAAGGLAGVWNPLVVAQGLPQALVGLNGEPVAATLMQVGATGAVSTPFQTTVGDDSALLRDYIVSPGPMITIDIVGLLPGDYQVLTYALGRQDFPHSSTSGSTTTFPPCRRSPASGRAWCSPVPPTPCITSASPMDICGFNSTMMTIRSSTACSWSLCLVQALSVRSCVCLPWPAGDDDDAANRRGHARRNTTGGPY